MKLFFHPDPNNNPILSEEESLHAVKVLRLKNQDTITILDGKGKLYEATITEAHAKKCRITITKTSEDTKKHPYYLHIAVAPTKNIDRIEWMVEKAIEIGVDEISFIQCEHSERKVINMERIEKISISALKQSMNLFLPKINPMISYSTFIKNTTCEAKFIAHLAEGERNYFKTEIQKSNSILILIGPEGDFSQEEIQTALTQKYQPVSLGESRLRTETAALAACFICNTIKA